MPKVPPIYNAGLENVATISGRRVIVTVRRALDDDATITIAEAQSQPHEREPWRFTFHAFEWRRMTALLPDGAEGASDD